MRRSRWGPPTRILWAAAAAVLSCPMLGGAFTTAHDAKAEEMAAIDGTRELSVEVAYLGGMEGLTLEVSVLWGFDWPRRFIHAPIDGSTHVLSGQTRLEGPGTQLLWIWVGEPEKDPLFACLTRFDVRDDEDIWIRVAAPREPDQSHPCEVTHLLHHDPAIEPWSGEPQPSPASG